MKKFYKALTILSLVLFTYSSVNAQITLPAHSSLYSNIYARGYWFTAPVAMTITGLMVAPEAGCGAQYIHLMKCNATFPVATTGSTSFNTLAYIQGGTNGVIQPVNISVAQGDQIGVLGTAGICNPTYTTSINNSYTASGVFTATIASVVCTLSRLGYQGNIDGGAATTFWGEAHGTAGQLGRVFIYYTTGPTCNAVTGLAASAITSNSATLSWTAVSGSLGYEYALTTSATPPTSGTTTSATSYPAGGLNPSTTYYMHVRNKCGTSTFSNWATVSFTTLTAPITCPPPTTLIMSGLTSSMANFNWNAVSSATSYEYKVDQVATGPTSGWSTTFSNNTTVTGLTENTGYYFHVRNVCIAPDKSAWLNYSFTTLICSKPTNVLVSNIGDTTADLMWSQMPSAASYDYAVDFSKDNPITGIKNTTGITTHLSSLIPNSKYYIHVRSRCFTVDSSGWRLDSFITKMNCYAPAVQVNYLGTNNPYAYWQPIPSAVAYEYALNNSSTPPAFGVTIYVTNISTLNLPEDGKDYYLHVRTKCNSQFTFSTWSTVALRTDVTGVPQVQQDGISMYPNPVKNTLYVKGANAGRYIINDITGREVINGTVKQGFAEINMDKLVPGTYMLKLQGNLQVFRFVKE